MTKTTGQTSTPTERFAVVRPKTLKVKILPPTISARIAFVTKKPASTI